MAAPDQQSQLQAELDSEFHVLRLLGEGSVAKVYLARERALQRLVAIKIMKSKLAEDEVARKRFERESRSTARIHHHNVAAVHRVGTLEDETPFIIMEYIEGRNLADALQAEGVMTIEHACQTLIQVASALAAAHESGIVHRDVKPDNVVQERDSGRVVLTDFGIAGILETGNETITRLTQQGQLLGDPRYMSPEQLLGETVTDGSDVYGLGIMGYELLTLKAPYEGKTAVQLVTAHLKKEPIPLTRLRPDADPLLAELLERCLSKNPRHRPRASEVARALEQVTEEPQTSEQARESDSFAGKSFSDAVQNIPALAAFMGELKRRHAGGVPGDSRSFVDVRCQLEGNPTHRVGCRGARSHQTSHPAGTGVGSQPPDIRAGQLVDSRLVASPVFAADRGHRGGRTLAQPESQHYHERQEPELIHG